MRIFCSIIALLLVTTAVTGNAGPPTFEPNSYQIIFDEDSGVELLAEKVRIEIDKEYSYRANVYVEYVMSNSSNESGLVNLLFITPTLGTEGITIKHNDVAIAPSERLAQDRLPKNWHLDERHIFVDPITSKPLVPPYDFEKDTHIAEGHLFSVPIPIGEEATIVIEYSQRVGMYDYSQLVNNVYSFNYYMTPATFWQGDAEVLLELIIPENYYFYSSIELEPTSDPSYFKARLDRVPKEEWTISFTSKKGILFGTNIRREHNRYINYAFFGVLLLGLVLIILKKKWIGIIVMALALPVSFFYSVTYGGVLVAFILVTLVAGGWIYYLIIRAFVRFIMKRRQSKHRDL